MNDDDVDHGNAPEVEQDDWMTLCRLNPRFPSPELDSDDVDVDWNEAARAMQLDILQECANWINVTRRLHPALRRALPSVDQARTVIGARGGQRGRGPPVLMGVSVYRYVHNGPHAGASVLLTSLRYS